MRTLFEMDKKNYDSSGKVFYRPSVRSIIIRGGRVAMVHSLMYDYYKFPGGGIESGETRHQALIRETAEESGLCVQSYLAGVHGNIVGRHSVRDGKQQQTKSGRQSFHQDKAVERDRFPFHRRLVGRFNQTCA